MKKQLLTIASLLAIHFANAQAPLIPAGNSFPNGFGIGVPVGANYSDAALHVRALDNNFYGSGNGQTIFYGELQRAQNGDNIRIMNAKGGAGNSFAPWLVGTNVTDNLSCGLNIGANIRSTVDLGTTPAMLFSTMVNFMPTTSLENPPIPYGTVGPVITRPLFQWRNSAAQLMTMTPTTAANGDARLGLGTTTPAWKLDIASPFTNDGIRVTQTTTSAATLKLKGGGTGSKEWSLWSGGSASGIGAGNFGIWDPTASRYRMSINGTTGNLRIGGTAILASATHRLHVIPESPNFDPVRFEGLNFAADPFIITADINGVLHKINSTGFGGISNSCTTASFIPMVQTTGSGNLTCSQIFDNGNVGINTITPTNKLHVVPVIGFDPVRFENLNSSNDTTIVTTDALGVLHTIGISSLLSGTGTTGINSSCSTANFVPKVQTTGSGDLTCSQIYDNGSEVGIGTSTPAAGWELEVNGDIKCVSLWATSDAKFKKDITPLKNANDIISKLQGVTYNWRTEEFKSKKFSTENQIGFIAQEVQKVLPAAVTKDANGDYAINYIEIIPVLTEAMKEQNATIENQNSKIENLENQLAEIKAMLSNGNKSSLNTNTQIANNNIKIYPNPIRNNNLNIEMFTHNEGSVWVTISDMQGKEVARKQFTTCANCTNNLTFDLPQLSNGNYHVSILADGQITTEKFTIAK